MNWNFFPDFLRYRHPEINGRPFRADRMAVKVDRFQRGNALRLGPATLVRHTGESPVWGWNGTRGERGAGRMNESGKRAQMRNFLGDADASATGRHNFFFPPFSRRSIILVGRIKKKTTQSWVDRGNFINDFSHWLPEFRRIFWLVAGKKIEKKFGKNLEKSLTHVKSLVKCLLTHSTTWNDFTSFLSFFKTIFSFEKFRNKSEKNI